MKLALFLLSFSLSCNITSEIPEQYSYNNRSRSQLYLKKAQYYRQTALDRWGSSQRDSLLEKSMTNIRMSIYYQKLDIEEALKIATDSTKIKELRELLDILQSASIP